MSGPRCRHRCRLRFGADADADAPDACGASDGTCNRRDDDCDGRVDEDAAELGTLMACAACDGSCGWDCEASGCNDAVLVTAGYADGCALREDGTVACWGWNAMGQLGDPMLVDSNVPLVVSGLGDVAEIAAGRSHTCALSRTGAVRCWGRLRS